MLYPKNMTEAPDAALFKNPTSEYRAAPLWSWNCKLEQERLNRGIACMREMGMGGVSYAPTRRDDNRISFGRVYGVC